jgi:hypothetical protein
VLRRLLPDAVRFLPHARDCDPAVCADRTQIDQVGPTLAVNGSGGRESSRWKALDPPTRITASLGA